MKLYAISEEFKLLAMELSIAREFIPSQNKAAYIYIYIFNQQANFCISNLFFLIANKSQKHPLSLPLSAKDGAQRMPKREIENNLQNVSPI